jgi:putative ABC transport system permease protein
MAWRNLWRNRKRTLITLSSILFALFFVIITRSLQLGSYHHMIESMTQMYTGHIQIHAQGYVAEPSLDYSFEPQSDLYSVLENHADVQYILPRLESFALVSAGERSRPVMILGADLKLEDQVSGMSGFVTEGEYPIQAKATGVVLGRRLAQQLQAQVGDTLVFLSQGFMGISSAGLFPIAAIVDLSLPDLNAKLVLMPLALAQDFFGSPQRLTSLVVLLLRYQNTAAFTYYLKDALSSEYQWQTWTEILNELMQQIKADEIQGLIMIWLLYVIVGFGMLSTILMMTKERTREFGVLLALGMQKSSMCLMVLIESILVGVTGLVAGLLASLPVLFWFYHHPLTLKGELAEVMMAMGWDPVIPVSFAPEVFTSQMVAIGFITLIISLYPLWIIRTLQPVEAMRS